MTRPATTIDAAEIGQFDAIAAQWWDPAGPFAPLHKVNPARLGFIRDHVCAAFGRDAASLTPYKGLSMLDIGCGGGLVAEPFARCGGNVTGIDAGGASLSVAADHARGQGLSITWRKAAAEALAEEGASFDIVTALEVVEHTADPALFLAATARLVRPGGMLFLSTLNRTARSFLLGKLAAEYVLRWLPRGTHDWRKFLKPSEIARPLRAAGLEVTAIAGIVYDPRTGEFGIKPGDVAVNFILAARRPA